MKKRTAFIGAILSFTSIIFFTGHVKSEEYICSAELSAFGRPGEVESGKYQRIGNYFVQTTENGKFKFSILKETSKFIVLAETYDYPDVFITILVIIGLRLWPREPSFPRQFNEVESVVAAVIPHKHTFKQY